ncbi:hypothetical protein KC19_9G154300 [Ceratodon purpureus]|uniref:Uncharacterized protein n=1 Tax=Ceratodon purpureus TaxID=3225 RepID=A0A8T0GS89_CERPU|nr:hypothetical protein KC19_9G154300 [Ceratodon purpureus]
MHTMASIPRCWASEAASVSSSQLSSLRFRSLSPATQVHSCRVHKRLQVRCSTQEELSTTREKVNLKNKDLNLPMQSELSDANVAPGDVNPEAAKKVLKEAKEKFGSATVAKALQEAKKKLGEQGPGRLALYGGAATLGVLLSGAILSSLEVYPIIPETMQIIGLACSALVASNVIQGKREKFQVSPVKAVIAIVDAGKGKVQQTSLVLPQDLDQGTVAAMERLARERDMAVNQVEEMKRQTSQYSQALAEKEALETVALQLAEERETAMSEVNILKSTVESMSDRMKGIEEMLDREIGLLKAQNQALETVALQLAQERDTAIKETANLKARSDAEKQALEEVAMQLAQERDSALLELENLMKVVANMRTPASG